MDVWHVQERQENAQVVQMERYWQQQEMMTHAQIVELECGAMEDNQQHVLELDQNRTLLWSHHIIQFITTNQTAEEVANQIKRVTGVTVEVIPVNKQAFEVRIVDGRTTTTTDVISLAKKIQDTMRNGSSELLRQINNIDIRVETLSSASTSTTSFNDLFFFFFHQQTLHTIIITFIITLLVVSLNLWKKRERKQNSNTHW